MTTFGISVVKDEADIIERVVRHMFGQVDRVIVADNGSTDGTREILKNLDVELIDDTEVGHYQARKLTELADLARRRGADWVVPFDADEFWFARDGRIADVLGALPETVLLAQAILYDHVATGTDYDLSWRHLAAVPLRKVACRARPDLGIQQGSHEAGYANVEVAAAALDLLVVRHFPYRSPEQLITKARNGARSYAATDLPEHLGAHKREFGRLTDEQLRAVFFDRFWSADPENDPGLVLDPCP